MKLDDLRETHLEVINKLIQLFRTDADLGFKLMYYQEKDSENEEVMLLDTLSQELYPLDIEDFKDLLDVHKDAINETHDAYLG